MRIGLNWLTPFALRLLSLSHASLAGPVVAALKNPRSVQLVTGLYVGLATTPQPHPQPDASRDVATTYVQLANHELTIPIMPLHLLGKKSWNVYNADNIAKVKRDEAEAAAKEAAEDERLQEIDREYRLQLLRGERPTPLALEAPPSPPPAKSDPLRERKKRKRFNEDDTDFELRLAKDQIQPRPSSTAGKARNSFAANTPLTDQNGHIDLFPHEGPAAANPEAAAEAARKKREVTDQYQLRFSNAAGLKTDLGTAPWYSTSGGDEAMAEVEETRVGKDVWGREDSGRRERDRARVAAGDPLGMMKWGAKEVRRVEGERARWVEEREKMDRGEERRDKRRRKLRKDENDDLEGFTLEEPISITGRDIEREKEHRYHNKGETERRERRERDEKRERREKSDQKKRARHEDRTRDENTERSRKREKERDAERYSERSEREKHGNRQRGDHTHRDGHRNRHRHRA